MKKILLDEKEIDDLNLKIILKKLALNEEFDTEYGLDKNGNHTFNVSFASGDCFKIKIIEN